MKYSLLALILLCSTAFSAPPDSSIEILANFRNPKIRWKDMPATEALHQLSLFAPKDAKGNSIFKYELIASHSKSGFKDSSIYYSSNQELFWDTASGIAAAANWKMAITDDGIWRFSDSSAWQALVKTEQGAAANP